MLKHLPHYIVVSSTCAVAHVLGLSDFNISNYKAATGKISDLTKPQGHGQSTVYDVGHDQALQETHTNPTASI